MPISRKKIALLSRRQLLEKGKELATLHFDEWNEGKYTDTEWNKILTNEAMNQGLGESDAAEAAEEAMIYLGINIETIKTMKGGSSKDAEFVEIPCSECDGTGWRQDSEIEIECERCNGTGWRDGESHFFGRDASKISSSKIALDEVNRAINDAGAEPDPRTDKEYEHPWGAKGTEPEQNKFGDLEKDNVGKFAPGPHKALTSMGYKKTGPSTYSHSKQEDSVDVSTDGSWIHYDGEGGVIGRGEASDFSNYFGSKQQVDNLEAFAPGVKHKIPREFDRLPKRFKEIKNFTRKRRERPAAPRTASKTYSLEELAKISREAGLKLYGKPTKDGNSGLIWNKPTQIIEVTSPEQLVEVFGDVEEEGMDHAVGDFTYIFKPSTGEGIDAAGESIFTPEFRDKDGITYSYSAEDDSIVELHSSANPNPTKKKKKPSTLKKWEELTPEQQQMYVELMKTHGYGGHPTSWYEQQWVKNGVDTQKWWMGEFEKHLPPTKQASHDTHEIVEAGWKKILNAPEYSRYSNPTLPNLVLEVTKGGFTLFTQDTEKGYVPLEQGDLSELDGFLMGLSGTGKFAKEAVFGKGKEQELYDDTAFAVIQYLKDESTLNLKGAKAKADPSVQGVWQVTLVSGQRVIVYLAGRKDPFGKRRTHNDFEMEDEPEPLGKMGSPCKVGSAGPQMRSDKPETAHRIALKNFKPEDHLNGLQVRSYTNDHGCKYCGKSMEGLDTLSIFLHVWHNHYDRINPDGTTKSKIGSSQDEKQLENFIASAYHGVYDEVEGANDEVVVEVIMSVMPHLPARLQRLWDKHSPEEQSKFVLDVIYSRKHAAKTAELFGEVDPNNNRLTKCQHCGKKKGDHQSTTYNCPVGDKSRIGYILYNENQKFEPKIKTAEIEMHETPRCLPPRDDMRRHIDKDLKKELHDDLHQDDEKVAASITRFGSMKTAEFSELWNNSTPRGRCKLLGVNGKPTTVIFFKPWEELSDMEKGLLANWLRIQKLHPAKAATEKDKYWLDQVADAEEEAKAMFMKDPNMIDVARMEGVDMEALWQQEKKEYLNLIYDPKP